MRQKKKQESNDQEKRGKKHVRKARKEILGKGESERNSEG